MEVKTDLVGPDRSATTAQNKASLQSRQQTQRLAPGGTREPGTPDSQTEEGRAAADEVDGRTQRLAAAQANREAAASAVGDPAAAHAQAALVASQIRSDSGQAWIAQASLSTPSALALLQE